MKDSEIGALAIAAVGSGLITRPCITTTEFAALIRSVAAEVDKGGPGGIADVVNPLRLYVAPDCHVGRGADMDHTDAGFCLQLQWYAGQLLSMVDQQQWHGINTWLNLVDKFTVPKRAPE